MKKKYMIIIVIVLLGIVANCSSEPEPKAKEITKTTNTDKSKDLKKVFEEKYNLTYFGNVKNDKTGKWRLAEYAHQTSQEVLALDYYKEFFKSDDEVHALINMSTKTTARISVVGDKLNVVIYEHVAGEEHDAVNLFGGMKLQEYEIDK